MNHLASSRPPRGFTLLELVVVLAVLVILAAMIVPLVSGTSSDAQTRATQASLRELQEIVMNRYRVDLAGQVSSTNSGVAAGLPGPDGNNSATSARVQSPQLHFLFVNPQTNPLSSTATVDPVTGRGWAGPYLLAGTGTYPGTDLYNDAAARGFTNQYGIPRGTGVNGDFCVLDGWGNPIVLAVVTYQGANVWAVVSAGDDQQLNLSLDNDTDGTPLDIGLPLLGVPLP